MFNALKLEAGLPTVDTYDQLINLLGNSVGYTFGDAFYTGNLKVGTDQVQPDADHPDWEWTPISGDLVTFVRCLVPNDAHDVVILVTGYRNGDRNKPVLCVWTTRTTLKSDIITCLSKVDGSATIGEKLAHALGYVDWALIGVEQPTGSNVFTSAVVTATGVTTATGTWLGVASLLLPDDGLHQYTTAYDRYSGLALMDPELEIPTMVSWHWNTSHSQGVIRMCKSSYDADYQNTTDIVHAALAKSIDVLTGVVGTLADSTSVDIAGLIAANGALYAAITQMPIFGNKFADVVSAMDRIDASSQYIPRP